MSKKENEVIIEEDICELSKLTTAELAHDYYEKLTHWIVEFEKGLDEEHEVGIRLVSFGQTITFVLTDIEYEDPALICFKGETDGGEPVELIQHVNQISILLMKQKIQKPEEEKEPIGFKLQKKARKRRKKKSSK